MANQNFIVQARNNWSNKRYSFKFLICLVTLFVVSITILLNTTVYAYSLIEGYAYPNSREVVPGMMVSLANKNSSEIELTTRDNVAASIGVVSKEGNGLLTLSNNNSNVYVATSGTLPVFVTDAKGAVKPGDYLAISSVAGVLAKAGKADREILGIASESFDSNKAKKATVTLDNGDTAVISIGLVTMHIKTFENPNHEKQSLFQQLGSKLVSKPVSNTQVIFGGIFFILSIATIFTLMSAAVRTAITAIGRNPLAKSSVLKSLFQLVLLSMAVLAAGLLGTYIILWI